jgi:hypothetical protein
MEVLYAQAYSSFVGEQQEGRPSIRRVIHGNGESFVIHPCQADCGQIDVQRA